MENRLSYPSHKSLLFDDLGNRRHVYVIARYYRNSDGPWYEAERFTTDAGCTFVIDGKIYFQCSDFLIPMNMDFDSPTCHACEKIIGEVHILYGVAKREVLGSADVYGFRGSLHKETSTYGTSFYSVTDHRGHPLPGMCGSDPIALSQSLLRCAEHCKSISPEFAAVLRQFSAVMDQEPPETPNPAKSGVVLSYLVGKNTLGEVISKPFPNLDEARTWAIHNVPKDSAGWSIYSAPGSDGLRLTLYDYRLTA